jgi:hypothetical protein
MVRFVFAWCMAVCCTTGVRAATLNSTSWAVDPVVRGADLSLLLDFSQVPSGSPLDVIIVPQDRIAGASTDLFVSAVLTGTMGEGMHVRVDTSATQISVKIAPSNQPPSESVSGVAPLSAAAALLPVGLVLTAPGESASIRAAVVAAVLGASLTATSGEAALPPSPAILVISIPTAATYYSPSPLRINSGTFSISSALGLRSGQTPSQKIADCTVGATTCAECCQGGGVCTPTDCACDTASVPLDSTTCKPLVVSPSGAGTPFLVSITMGAKDVGVQSFTVDTPPQTNVFKVEVFVDDDNAPPWIEQNGVASVPFSLDTSPLAVGSHSLIAHVLDWTGNQGSATVAFSVANASSGVLVRAEFDFILVQQPFTVSFSGQAATGMSIKAGHPCSISGPVSLTSTSASFVVDACPSTPLVQPLEFVVISSLGVSPFKVIAPVLSGRPFPLRSAAGSYQLRYVLVCS